jgi:hypothetical protein
MRRPGTQNPVCHFSFLTRLPHVKGFLHFDPDAMHPQQQSHVTRRSVAHRVFLNLVAKG